MPGIKSYPAFGFGIENMARDKKRVEGSGLIFIKEMAGSVPDVADWEFFTDPNGHFIQFGTGGINKVFP